jgi:hypothetical protein
MDEFSSALAILSAMITPAVLISACGSMILTTSQRLGRVIDRTRKIADHFEALAQAESDGALVEEERSVLFDQLGRAAQRSRLLQRAMTALYLALSVFVATSIAIAGAAITGQSYAWLPIALGVIGAALLWYASLVLIGESRVALGAVREEMDFVLRVGRHFAPVELLERQPTTERGRFFRRSK